jgi:hypothetical protein
MTEEALHSDPYRPDAVEGIDYQMSAEIRMICEADGTQVPRLYVFRLPVEPRPTIESPSSGDR